MPILFQECHLLVTLPDGMLQLRCEPGMSDNVKINVFFVFAYRGVDKALRLLGDARNLPFGKRLLIKMSRQNDAYASLSD